ILGVLISDPVASCLGTVMDNVSAAHPSAKVLMAFRLGKLTEAQRATVSRPLAVCDACRQAAHRGAGNATGSSPRPPKGRTLPAGGAAPAAVDPRTSLPPPAPPDGVPPELADHPRYRILRELGRGGMGVVYQAQHRLMERLVAIKVINKSLLDQPEALERFHQEVRAAAALPSHPNIVTASDAEQAGALHLPCMETVAGRS